MLESDPFNPLVYWPHVVLGISSVFAVLAAIFSAKGSPLHRKAGITFSVAMGVAATTAILFSFWRFAPNALFSSFTVAYGIGMGILSLRPRAGGWRVAQWLLVIIPIMATLFALIGIASLFAAQLPLPLLATGIALSSSVAIFFAVLAWKDIAFLRGGDADRFDRLRRHALRMAVAGAEVVRAPLMSFGPPIGPDGALTIPLYFFGPFLLIPLIYFLAMPNWVKRRDAPAFLRPVSA